MLFFFFLNCYFQAFMDCVRPSTATPQTVTNLASFHADYQHPELLQTSLQEEEELCQTSPWPWGGWGGGGWGGRFADAPFISEGMTSLQTTLEGLFKR